MHYERYPFELISGSVIHAQELTHFVEKKASYWKMSIFHDFLAEYNVEFGKIAIAA